jgi:hypothetical protein
MSMSLVRAMHLAIERFLIHKIRCGQRQRAYYYNAPDNLNRIEIAVKDMSRNVTGR